MKIKKVKRVQTPVYGVKTSIAGVEVEVRVDRLLFDLSTLKEEA